MLGDIDTSEFDDLVKKVHWLLRKGKEIVSLVLVHKVQGLVFVVYLVAEKNEVAFLSLSLLFESSPPGDELEGVLEEVVVVPFSEIQESSKL